MNTALALQTFYFLNDVYRALEKSRSIIQLFYLSAYYLLDEQAVIGSAVYIYINSMNPLYYTFYSISYGLIFSL